MIKLDAKTQLTPEECFDLCYKFVSTFSVIHYVHSLELGTSHHRVMSLEEYSMKFSSKSKLGVGQMADIVIGNQKSHSAKKYKSQTTKVGCMKLPDRDDDDSRTWGIHFKRSKSHADGGDSKVTEIEEEVLRSTIGEAVVGVKLQPISSLVFSSVGLRTALQKALQLYIHNKQKVKCKYQKQNQVLASFPDPLRGRRKKRALGRG